MLRSHKFAGHSEPVTKTHKEAHQRPEGRLIEAAMKRMSVSGRQLADRVKMSEGRVRQIVNGYRTEGGSVIPISGPADTVARIATEVGISAREMREAGREDVAAEMNPLRSVGVTEDGALWLSDNAERHQALREWLDEVQTSQPDLKPPTDALTLWDFEQLMEAAIAAHHDELRFKDYFIEMFGRRQTSSPTEPDVYGRRPEGGDGDDSERAAAPNTEAVSEVDDTLGAAAKEQEIQGSGEEGSI